MACHSKLEVNLLSGEKSMGRIKLLYRRLVWLLTGKVKVESKHLDITSKMPVRAYKFDAANDLYSIEDIKIPPRGLANIGTGISFVLPEGFYATIDSRSSFNIKGCIALRGIIDATFQSDMKCILANLTDNTVEIKCGDRIAQIMIHPSATPIITVLNNSDSHSKDYCGRNELGFGSSGRR